MPEPSYGLDATTAASLRDQTQAALVRLGGADSPHADALAASMRRLICVPPERLVAYHDMALLMAQILAFVGDPQAAWNKTSDFLPLVRAMEMSLALVAVEEET